MAEASSGLGKLHREKKQKNPSAKIAGPSEYNKRVAEFLLYEEAPHYDHCEKADKKVRMANLHKACGSIQKCRIATTSQTVATVQKLRGVGKKRATMVIFRDFQISCQCFGFDVLFQIGLFVETKKFKEGLLPDLQLGRLNASVQHSYTCPA